MDSPKVDPSLVITYRVGYLMPYIIQCTSAGCTSVCYCLDLLDSGERRAMPRTARQKLLRKENELYKAIGEFMFWFSQLEFTIKARLAGALQLDNQFFTIVIGPYDFAMLCTVTRETLSVGADGATKKRIHSYFGQCQRLNQNARLIIAHGSWTLDGAHHISRSSLKSTLHFQSPPQIKKHTIEAKRLMRELFALGATHR